MRKPTNDEGDGMNEEKHPITIVVDLDGTLAEYDQWNPNIGTPMEGAKEALITLKKEGYKIVIQTTRLHPRWGMEQFQSQYNRVCSWLERHKIPYDEIDVFGKAIANYYIDDRAIKFISWKQILQELLYNESTH